MFSVLDGRIALKFALTSRCELMVRGTLALSLKTLRSNTIVLRTVQAVTIVHPYVSQSRIHPGDLTNFEFLFFQRL